MTIRMDKREFGILIRRARIKRGLTQQALANLINYPQQGISRIESGKQGISTELLLKLAEVLNLHDLIPHPPEIKDLESGDLVQVKLIADMISLGPGYDISQEHAEAHIPMPKTWLPGWTAVPDRYIAVRASGNSMAPVINDGAILFIDRLQIIPQEGQIFAILLPNKQITAKRVIKIYKSQIIIDGDNQDKQERLMGELKDYPMIINLTEADDPNYPIRGRVVWVLNKL
jgi:transcriptional regulator with XRE-family HTH domain